MIKSNISCFENIDYNILNNIIKNKLKPDRSLMGLLQKLLKSGYLLNPSTFAHMSENIPLLHSNKDGLHQD